MAEYDAEIADTDQSRGIDVVLLPYGEHDASGDTCEDHPAVDGEDDDNVSDAGPDHGHDYQSQQQTRKGGLGIHNPHDDVINATAIVARYQTEDGAHGAGYRYHTYAHCHRDTGSMNQATENVSPLLIGAQDIKLSFLVDEARGLEALPYVASRWIVR